MTAFRDRLKTTISNTPSTSGNLTISGASSGFKTFDATADGLLFDILISEGTDWELRKDCQYTHSTTTLTRGTLVSSSSGSAVSFTSSAIVSNVLLAQRTIPTTITAPSTNQLIHYDGTNWVNYTPTYAQAGANSDITSLTGITGDISTADSVTFDTVNAQTPGVGKLTWDQTYGTLQVGLVGGNVNLQVGQEEVLLIHNGTGSTLTDGQVVYITGSTGDIPSVALASNSTEVLSAKTIGVVTESISNGSNGFITLSGLVHGLNTNAYTEGDMIWLGSTAGTWTTTEPVAPAHAVFIGWVIKKAGGNGSILVHVQNGYELDELHNVLITSVADKNLLQYDSASTVWKNVTFDAVVPSQTSNNGKFLFTNGSSSSWQFIDAVNTVSFASSISASVAGYSIVRVTLTGNITSFGLTGGHDGQKIIVEFIQDSSGNHTVSFDSSIRFGTDITSATLTTTANKMDRLGLVYNASANKYDVLAFAKGY